MCNPPCVAGNRCTCNPPARDLDRLGTYQGKAYDLKVEVGKTYLTRDKEKIKIVFKDEDVFAGKSDLFGGRFLTYEAGGKRRGWASGSKYTIVKEYVEPVIHRRVVCWYSVVSTPQFVLCTTFRNKEEMVHWAQTTSSYVVHHIEEITYVEGMAQRG